MPCCPYQWTLEVTIRLSTRILALINMVLSSAALALFAMDALIGFSDVDLHGYLFILPALLAIPMTLATFIVGFITTGQRRQFGWMIGLIGACLVAIAAPTLVGILGQSFLSHPETIPSCQVAAPPPGCQPSATDIFWQNAPTWAFLAGAFVVGLVASFYSFSTPKPSAGPHSHTES